MFQYNLFLGYVVIRREPGVCHGCPPDLLFNTEISVVRNKEVRKFPDGREEKVCLVCENKTQLRKESRQERQKELETSTAT